jgi:hypothetical protein
MLTQWNHVGKSIWIQTSLFRLQNQLAIIDHTHVSIRICESIDINKDLPAELPQMAKIPR